ncbi:hypothetical protein [Clostridium sp. Marseille-QA1073]
MVEFSYKLTGVGVCEGFININGNISEFTPYNITDAIGDLLQAIVNILEESIDGETEEYYFIWHDNPNQHKWEMYLEDKENIRIKITNETYDGETISVDIDTIYEFKDFIREILRECELLLKNHGIIGYRTKWVEYEFPLGLYMKLKKYILSNMISKEGSTYISEELDLLKEYIV